MSGSRGTGSRGSRSKRGDAGGGERLQKVLARVGVASRRRVEEMIREGRITVNGRGAELGQRVHLGTDAVKVDGKIVLDRAAERRYLLVNKPTGCVSTLDDPEGRPTVLEMIPTRLRKGLVPVGRLDFDTEGLLILTDDGDLAHHVTHPRYGCLKTYEVKVKGRPKGSEIQRLRQGVMLDGKLTAPAQIVSRSIVAGHRSSVSNSWWTVTLGEGRTRQIREMFFRIGHPVNRLRRVAIGPVSDPRLPRGGWRELTEGEVIALQRRTAQQSPQKSAPGGRASSPRPPRKPISRGASRSGTAPRKPSPRKPSPRSPSPRRPASGGKKGPRGGRG